MVKIQSELPTWDEVKGTEPWPSLLLGNGFSRNIWDRFAYSSLLEASDIEPQFLRIFEGFCTQDFEDVLGSLWRTEVVLKALETPCEEVAAAYSAIKDGLISTVHKVHPARSAIGDHVFSAIAEDVVTYSNIFTLNYDLLLYWTIMKQELTSKVKDYFWRNSAYFDVNDTDSQDTLVHFLHGALHLETTADGRTRKRTSSAGALLNQFGTEDPGQSRPLFVSEGTTVQKLKAIRASEYLRFCHSQLEGDRGNLVTFGVRFGNQDAHILEALRQHGGRRVAVSVFPGSIDHREQEILEARLSPCQVDFFDSTTHPLGLSSLTCTT